MNLVGPFRLTKVLIGSMLLRGRGLVVNVSSDAAIVGYPGWGAYGISKAGFEQMGRIWAAEADGAGVRLVTVDPGEMDTRMHAEAVPDADARTLTDPAEAARRMIALIRRIEEVPNGARVDLSRGMPAPPRGREEPAAEDLAGSPEAPGIVLPRGEAETVFLRLDFEKPLEGETVRAGP